MAIRYVIKNKKRGTYHYGINRFTKDINKADVYSKADAKWGVCDGEIAVKVDVQITEYD